LITLSDIPGSNMTFMWPCITTNLYIKTDQTH